MRQSSVKAMWAYFLLLSIHHGTLKQTGCYKVTARTSDLCSKSAARALCFIQLYCFTRRVSMHILSLLSIWFSSSVCHLSLHSPPSLQFSHSFTIPVPSIYVDASIVTNMIKWNLPVPEVYIRIPDLCLGCNYSWIMCSFIWGMERRLAHRYSIGALWWRFAL